MWRAVCSRFAPAGLPPLRRRSPRFRRGLQPALLPPRRRLLRPRSVLREIAPPSVLERVCRRAHPNVELGRTLPQPQGAQATAAAGNQNLADRIIDGKRHGDAGVRAPGIGHPIAQHSPREAGVFLRQRDERRESLQVRPDRQLTVFEIDPGNWKLTSERRPFQPGRAGSVSPAQAGAPSCGGATRLSSTRATGLPLPTLAQIHGNAYVGDFALSGRLKISQSRNCPRPPRLMLPAAMPPSGNAILSSCRPLNLGAELSSGDPFA